MIRLLIALLICSNVATAQSNLDKGWAAFNKNNRKEAREYFVKASAEPASKAESFLALALIEEVDGKNESAFNNFLNFFKASEDPYPYLFAFWHTDVIFSYQAKQKENRLAFLNSILMDPKANGTLKAMAHSTFGKHYQASNDIVKSREAFGKIASIDKWQLTGEFENISESGFEKNFDPITKATENAVFTNKNGAKVKWFDMKGNREDKWMDFTYHFFTDNSIIYAQTFVSSPAT